jgi:hypothetical protein
MSAMQQFCKRRKVVGTVGAFERIDMCRKGLEALDRQGWNRSYHQRQFHEQFIRACARIFYKTEPLGTFQRDHQRLLQGTRAVGADFLANALTAFGRRERLEQSVAGDSNLYAPAFRENHIRQLVCGRHALQRPPRGAQHLQHVQAHQSEAPAQHKEVPRPDLRRAGDAAVPRG